MAKRYPTRSTSHELEELSERFFRSNLPTSWTCERPLHDYGVDLRVEIYEDGAATGLELLVQLKATAAATVGDAETVRLQTATYNHLRDRLQVAMLVKFVAAAREAYWLFLRDVAAPNQFHHPYPKSESPFGAGLGGSAAPHKSSHKHEARCHRTPREK